MDSSFTLPDADGPLDERLERGEVHAFESACPMPPTLDQTFLREQELRGGKEIVFEASSHRLSGCHVRSAEHAARLREIFFSSQRAAADWLRPLLPRYAAFLTPARTSFHVVEEATRRLRISSRYDVLHFDTLHHAHGRRMLRLCINLNPTDPRVFASSKTLETVLPEYGPSSGLFEAARELWPARMGREMLRLIRHDFSLCDPFDQFAIEFSRYLKHSEEFQEKAPRKIHRFGPGQAWLTFTDSLIHADLRGRWILDHLFLIPPDVCALPDLAPISIVERMRQARMSAAA